MKRDHSDKKFDLHRAGRSLARWSLAFLALLQLVTATAQAQGEPAPSSDENATSTTGGTTLNVPRGNPLQGLFTPQPQFSTAQTQSNPQPAAPPAGELNPLKGLFTPQPQFITPQAKPNPDAEPQAGEVNHLKGLFTPPHPFVTPQTVPNPQPVPQHLVPERQLLWGTEEERQSLIRQHNLNTFGVEEPPEKGAPAPSPQAQSAANGEKKKTAPPAKAAVETMQERLERSKLHEALFLLHSGKLEECARRLDEVLVDRPSDAQTHYLKAVALVGLRRYTAAAAEYTTVLKLSQEEALTSLARAGLKKLGALPPLTH